MRSPGEVIREMFGALLRSRYLAYRLFIKDLRSEYSRTAFGVFWDFLDPLIMGGVFYALMRIRVLSPGDLGMPYALFVIYGLLIYQTFVEGITFSLDVMRRSGSMLTQLKVPPEALLLSVMYRLLFNSIFRLAVMLVFSIALIVQARDLGLDAFSPLGFLAFVACYPILILAGMSIGILLAPFQVIYTDIGRLTRTVLVPLRYLTPVLYQIPIAWLLKVNPIAIIVSDMRRLATSGEFASPGEFAARAAGFAVLFLFGWFVFHVSLPVLAERA
jgi:lipopolysaccharide transport system permease protein